VAVAFRLFLLSTLGIVKGWVIGQVGVIIRVMVMVMVGVAVVRIVLVIYCESTMRMVVVVRCLPPGLFVSLT
jgi:hypothetical protein